MDSLLVVGNEDRKLCTFLQKLGYTVVKTDQEQNLPEVVNTRIIDLVLFDTRSDLEPDLLLQYLRADERTKNIPIVCLVSGFDTRAKLEELHDDKLEILPAPCSMGSVVSRIATRLRLQKIAGAEEGQASLAEVNAALRELNRHISHQLEEARSIQQSLLPQQLPYDPRYELAVVYEPLEEVGGDWYFIKEEEDKSISAQIADITGHGLAAAFISSMTKLAMTAAKRTEPGELLTEMNRLMAPQLPSGRFVTMCAYYYDPAGGRLQLSRAGHPPALLLHRATGEVEHLVPDGFPIGFFDDASYASIDVVLEHDDLLAIYTDGLIEARNRSGQLYGVERFSNILLNSKPTESAASVLGRVLSDFNNFLDSRRLADDLTMVLLKRCKG